MNSHQLPEQRAQGAAARLTPPRSWSTWSGMELGRAAAPCGVAALKRLTALSWAVVNSFWCIDRLAPMAHHVHLAQQRAKEH